MTPSRTRTIAELAAVLSADSVFARGHDGGAEHRGGRHRERAARARRLMEQLGPFYIKLGQVLATRPDFVSPAMMDELARLQDRVSVQPFAVFEPVLRDELDGDWRRLFRDVDTARPLGSASLAQAYRVTLRSGESAVLKVQRPGVRARVLADMAAMRRAASLARRLAPPRVNAVVDLGTTLGVVFDAMQPELDFTVEAATMTAARRAARSFRHVSVPEVVLATPRLIVQSTAPGASIRDADLTRFSQRRRAEIGRDLLAFMYHGYYVERMFHADPHPGNVFIDPCHGATLIDWGMVGRLDRTLSTMTMLTVTSMAMNDARGASQGWIQMGHATQWADIGGFTSDMERMLPRLVSSPLGESNFGSALLAVLRSAARRGIRSSPMVALLGRSFANAEGSVRCIAPGLVLADVYKDVMVDVLIALARELLSGDQACRFAMDAMLNVLVAGDQGRSMLRDIANREFAIKVGRLPGGARPESAGSLPAGAGVLAGLALMGGWRLSRAQRRH